VREQRLQPSEIALLGGREEPSGQLVMLLTGRLEARPALLEVAPGADGELANVVFALADDRRDLRVAVAEHLTITRIEWPTAIDAFFLPMRRASRQYWAAR
jgi:hypothetical protein